MTQVSCFSLRPASRLRLRLLLFRLFDLHSGDAVAFQLFDRVAAAFVFEGLVAQVRDALQAGEDESGQGFETGVAREESGRIRFRGRGC